MQGLLSYSRQGPLFLSETTSQTQTVRVSLAMINYQALRPFRNHDKLDRHLQQTNDKLARSMYRGYLGFAQILILAALATTLTPLLRPVMSAIMDFLLSV